MPALASSTVIPCASSRTPVRSPADPEVIREGVVAWDGPTLTFVGPRSGWDGDIDEELAGRTIVPGFIDCHTHLPFYGWRDDEYEVRLGGRSYRELHGEGGIARSARMLAEASDEAVLEFCSHLIAEMARHGTTALELKTGYGLSVEAELRQARLARRLAAEAPQTATVTLLGCHAVPDGVERDDWVDRVCTELIPAAAGDGLIEAVDIYIEDIAFSVGDLGRVADAATAAGVPFRCHADQLGNTRAAEAAVAFGARSADHLNHTDDLGIRALGNGDTAAVLLPTSTLLLDEALPRVRALSEAGAALAVATDCNPGTSPVTSMPEAIATACALYRMQPLEALVAATINPAWVLGLHERLGSLERGKRADLVILDVEDFRMVPYRPGHNPVVGTIIGGEPMG